MALSEIVIIIESILLLLAVALVLFMRIKTPLSSVVRQLEVENDRLRHVSMAIGGSNVLLEFDGNGELVSVNSTFRKLYGMELREYKLEVGPSLSDYLAWSGFRDSSSIDEPVSFMGNTTLSSGETIWKQINITPNKDENGDVYYIVLELDVTSVKEAEMELQKQKKRSDELLVNMLPAEIVEELKVRGRAKPRVYDSASVLFADIKNFTQWAERLSPNDLITTLQELFSAFDDVLAANYIEKIKTIGDAYMCAGGLPMKNNSHPFDIVIAAFGLQTAVRKLDEKRAREGGEPWLMRIGINTGPVVTGVVGKTRTVYDIWGDSVNVASRLESECEPGKVNISASTYEVIKDYFECEYRGKVPAKHKGEIDMYFVNRLKPEYSADADGFVPNKVFVEMLSEL